MSVASALLVLALGCSSNVQDLGRNTPADTPTVEPASSPGEGLGAEWAASPSGRDLACPLTRPIEGDECPARNTAPCTYHGAPEHGPDTPPLPGEGDRSTTLCMCMQSHRWRCAQGVTLRTMLRLPVEGDPCIDSMVIEHVGSATCRCAGGRLRCGS